VRGNPHMPIFGSGDVWGVNDIFRMLAYTGVAGVSVARGCIGNPWIFRQAREMMAGSPPSQPTIAEQRAVLDEHFRLLLAVHHESRKGELHAAKQMRKFGIRFSAHHPKGEEVRLRMIAVSSLAEWQGVLEDYYSNSRQD
jgi:tRNA-dihydrouridine synthase B